jgi:hypothetical protein
MKPLGVTLNIDARGAPVMRMARISRAEDAIWEAVLEAQSAGWTPQQFIREARQAWAESRAQSAKDETATFDKALRGEET